MSLMTFESLISVQPLVAGSSEETKLQHRLSFSIEGIT